MKDAKQEKMAKDILRFTKGERNFKNLALAAKIVACIIEQEIVAYNNNGIYLN